MSYYFYINNVYFIHPEANSVVNTLFNISYTGRVLQRPRCWGLKKVATGPALCPLLALLRTCLTPEQSCHLQPTGSLPSSFPPTPLFYRCREPISPPSPCSGLPSTLPAPPAQALHLTSICSFEPHQNVMPWVPLCPVLALGIWKVKPRQPGFQVSLLSTGPNCQVSGVGRGPADVTEPLGHHHPQSPTEHCLDSPLLINLDPFLLPPHSECCFGGGGQVGFSPSFPWFLTRSSISICSLSLESPLLDFSVHNPLSSYLAILSDF